MAQKKHISKLPLDAPMAERVESELQRIKTCFLKPSGDSMTLRKVAQRHGQSVSLPQFVGTVKSVGRLIKLSIRQMQFHSLMRGRKAQRLIKCFGRRPRLVSGELHHVAAFRLGVVDGPGHHLLAEPSGAVLAVNPHPLN